MKRQIIPDVVRDQPIYSLTKESTALEAAKRMAESNVAAIVVIEEGGELVGIVTERDLTQRVLAKGLDPDGTSLADIMTESPHTLSPTDTALDALELMHTHNFRHLPVVDKDRVVAMVSIRDLYAVVKKDLEDDLRNIEAFAFGEPYGG